MFIKGELSEWFKEHAWKVCVRQKRTEGSNPSLSAAVTIVWRLYLVKVCFIL